MTLKIPYYLPHLQALANSESCTSESNLQPEGGEWYTIIVKTMLVFKVYKQSIVSILVIFISMCSINIFWLCHSHFQIEKLYSHYCV